jgi:hypothetical protein
VSRTTRDQEGTCNIVNFNFEQRKNLVARNERSRSQSKYAWKSTGGGTTCAFVANTLVPPPKKDVFSSFIILEYITGGMSSEKDQHAGAAFGLFRQNPRHMNGAMHILDELVRKCQVRCEEGQ